MALAGLATGAFWLPAQAAGPVVEVTDYRFLPRNPVIELGQSVTWKFVEGDHTVTAEDGSFDVEKLAGETFTVTFDRPGNFAYYCEFDRGVGMTGVIKVRDKDAPPAPAAAPPTATSTAPGRTAAAAPSPAPAPAEPSSTTTTEPPTTTSSFPPLNTTTTAAAAAVVPPPDLGAAPPADPPASAPADEAAVTAILKDEKEPKDKTVLIAGIGVGVALTGLAGWAWWHRSSRYLPA